MHGINVSTTSSKASSRALDDLFAQCADARLQEKRNAVSIERNRRAARSAEFTLKKEKFLEQRAVDLKAWASQRRVAETEARTQIQTERLALAERAHLQRSHVLTASPEAVEQVLKQNKLRADQLREFKHQLHHVELAQKDGDAATLSEAAVEQVSGLVNAAMRNMLEKTDQSWSKLFRFMDSDSSGVICFQELHDTIRGPLAVSTTQLPEASLRALWRTLDVDKSGFICLAGWGKFMRMKEELSVASGGIAAQQVAEAKDTAQREIRSIKASGLEILRQEKRARAQALSARAAAQREALPLATAAAYARIDEARQANALTAREERHNRLHPKLFGGETVSSASEDTMKVMATRLTKAAAALRLSWASLFTFTDCDSSGLVTFGEVRALIRETLRMTKDEISDSDLKSIWKTLDDDSSGYISVAEFGRFMNLGNHIFADQRAAKNEARAEEIEKLRSSGKQVRRLLQEQHKTILAREAEAVALRTATLRQQENEASEAKFRAAAEAVQEKLEAKQKRHEETAAELRKDFEETQKIALQIAQQAEDVSETLRAKRERWLFQSPQSSRQR